MVKPYITVMANKKIKIEYLTNSEINIKMKEMTDEYEATKTEIVNLFSKLENLDKEYDKLRTELKKRGITVN